MCFHCGQSIAINILPSDFKTVCCINYDKISGLSKYQCMYGHYFLSRREDFICICSLRARLSKHYFTNCLQTCMLLLQYDRRQISGVGPWISIVLLPLNLNNIWEKYQNIGALLPELAQLADSINLQTILPLQLTLVHL